MRYHSLKHYRNCLRMLLDKHGEDRAWHVEELNKHMGIRGNKRKSFLKDRSKLLLFFKS